MDLSYTENQILIQSQSQKLALTTEMRESLALLQMPLPELKQKIAQAVIENPVLEYEEEYPAAADELADCALGADSETYQDEKAVLELAKRLSSDAFFPDSYTTHGTDAEDFLPFATLTAKATFTDYLLEQLRERKTDAVTAKICRYIIEDLDDRGYLTDPAEEVSKKLHVPLETIHNALAVVRQMQPAGVGAANLRECLTLQLLQNPSCNGHLIKIVEEHMELLAENRIPEIAKRLALSVKTVQEYCNIIRRLNPIPSSGFYTQNDGGFVIPEAAVSKVGDGFVIQGNDRDLPRLCISAYYRQLVKNLDDKEAIAYLKDKIRQAASLIKGLHNRKSTISRVLERIVEFQKPYFENGYAYLKPMTIADIAAPLGMNESTVSRAIHEKYITCQFGTISLKSLFTSRIPLQDGGGALSSLSVRQKIRAIIETEDKSTPLSDEDIANKMNDLGIIISRRTVAKYRGQMRIPKAKLRRNCYSDSKTDRQAAI
ncbi:RNA polymerase factor sigma-54 [Caproiciproducens galactitolivorans]|uniref:RNA polymerase sigma-54 factor 1 n=1 Tax=Caproiciproducens galactitolivorans TaxID=642589 RepID=A0A4Z0XZH5_9FIRM|nr:RNA polymerase factor sigma-54 [Caproiciproducens galactitolivorans]QEY35173.1 RNA polymerase factor sigma-54 [Caproiciproducens galactitolivorans]TGJ76864.1 RNA polymerase sigma-54 factor 1 [Caproiciproducens galactitolivorans]